MIPKVIHYCWFGPKPFSRLILRCIESWREELPDYEICLWNETNSPMDNKFVQKAYSAKKYAFVSDYVRFWVLHNYGGIYLDTDMYLIRSLNDFLNNKVFFGWESADENKISCGIIGACTETNFIKNILERYHIIDFDLTSIPDMVIPRIVSSCFTDYPCKEEVTIFSYDYFYPFPYEEKEDVKNFMKYITENTYAVHLWNISWGLRKDKLRDAILYFLKKKGINFSKL
jgi:mannosyltransferase OCH1-like enzyme